MSFFFRNYNISFIQNVSLLRCNLCVFICYFSNRYLLSGGGGNFQSSCITYKPLYNKRLWNSVRDIRWRTAVVGSWEPRWASRQLYCGDPIEFYFFVDGHNNKRLSIPTVQVAAAETCSVIFCWNIQPTVGTRGRLPVWAATPVRVTTRTRGF